MFSEVLAANDDAPGAIRAVLADGSVAQVRPLTTGDADELRRLHVDLSDEDRYRRFFGAASPTTIDRFVRNLVGASDAHTLVLGAYLRGRLIGAGHFTLLATAEEAELAFVVEHALHARGVATLLLEHLASAARRRGVRRFIAEVLAENSAMLKVFTDSGLRCRTRFEGGMVSVELDLDADEQYYTRVSDRERVADVASLRRLLRPSSVAVVGASRRPLSIGNATLRNIIAGGYPGRCYAINRNATEVEGIPAFHSVTDLPEPPDLAVLCVPARSIPDVAEDCGRRGARALLVMTAGITDDPELAHRLLDAVRRWGMRLVGPNCIGLVNSDPDVRLDATFTAAGIPAGAVGVVTQSGGVGIALLEALSACGLGVSTMVSTGDKYDVSGNDMLLWWDRDEDTHLGVLYLESFGNPRKFAWLARRMAQRKPLVVLKSGASPVAQRAAASHTAATATPGTTRDALLRQAGVIGVDGLGQLLAVVGLLEWQPLPGGPRVAVLGNAGGLGVLTADACARVGLELPELASSTRAALAELLPEHAALGNPVDTTAGIDDRTFARCLEIVREDPGIDVVVAPVVETAITDPASKIARAAQGSAKPVLAVRAGQIQTAVPLQFGHSRVPAFADPDVAARALADVAGYARWRARPRGVVPDLPEIDVAAARDVVATALRDESGGKWMEPLAVQQLLGSFGLPVVSTTVCADESEAIDAFHRLGGRVAVKAWADGVLHKARSGGVVLGVGTETEVREAWSDLRARLGNAFRGVLVQPMAERGREFLVGVSSEPVFGPLVVFGFGGVDTDLVADRSHRLVPLTDRDAVEMLGDLRSSPRLFGEHAEATLDTESLVDVLLRVARMAELLPEVVDMDLNPVIVTAHGARIPDARIRVQQREPDEPLARRLHI